MPQAPFPPATRSTLRPLPAPLLPTLAPAQAMAMERVLEALQVAPVVGLMGRSGSGRSTIARHLAKRPATRLVRLGDMFAACQQVEGQRWDEAVGRLLMESVPGGGVLIVDGYDAVLSMSGSAAMRGRLLHLFHHALGQRARARQARLLLIGNPPPNYMAATDVFGEDAVAVLVPGFLPDDYASLLGGALGREAIAAVDFKQVHRYASTLGGYQLLRLAAMLREVDGPLDTQAVVQAIQAHLLTSNTRLEQVEALSFDTLPGTAHIAEALETHVILPFEQPALAQQMGLRPKRGVLLHGRPGTGKTSIGRALAHRIKGKFFLIDGTVNSEPPGVFFDQLRAIVEQAKAHAPAVLFIDDADVLFGIHHIAGLPRYLLSLLDGLESEGARDVCVVMTAMDPARIPAALLRSGRVELWLETPLPDPGTRAAILRRWLGKELTQASRLDDALLAEATDGFTAADLRRVAADARTLCAVDRLSSQPDRGAMFYAASAINGLVAVRRRLAALLQDDTLRVGHAIEIALQD